MSPDQLLRSGPNSRGILVGDAVLLRQKWLNEVGGSRTEAVRATSWMWNTGIVIDSMEEDYTGFLQFEVMFGHEIGWWDDYELKLVEEVKDECVS